MRVKVQLVCRSPSVQDILDVVGETVRNQTRNRIAARGDSQGHWPESRFTNAFSKASRIGELLKSQDYDVGPDEVFVGTRYEWARTMHYGTVGAGGSLPDIVPVNKKALFIPLTNRGVKSRLVGRIRVGVKSKRGAGPGDTDVDLKRGRLRGGVLEVRKRQGRKWVWLPGQADFILLRRAKLPPRPLYRITVEDRQEIGENLAPLFVGG